MNSIHRPGRRCERPAMNAALRVLVVGIAIAAAPPRLDAAFTDARKIFDGLDGPVFATPAPGDPDRLYIVELYGDIHVANVRTGVVERTPFLTIGDTYLTSASENGFLGMAFHPDFQNNGKFYTYTTGEPGDATYNGSPAHSIGHVREYTVSDDPNFANPDPKPILSIVLPQGFHRGGWMGFNPKVNDDDPQYLYIAQGDGRIAEQAQVTDETLLGKILRIDVDGDDFVDDDTRNYAIPADNPFVGSGRGEIWAYGLRNPWRNSFDPVTGDLWIGDVGEARREEINFLPGSSGGGENYAWPRREGTEPFLNGQSEPGDVEPVYEYTRGSGDLNGNAVFGGYVYRGPDPELYGTYVFGDNPRGRIWTFDPADPFGTADRLDSQLPNGGLIVDPASLAQDAQGNLYVVDLFGASLGRGRLIRLLTDAVIPGDYDANGVVDDDDFAVFQATYGSTTDLGADGNGDGVVDAADYTVWRTNNGMTVADFVAANPSNTIPEPSGCLLVGTLLAAAGRRTRSRV